MTENKIDINLKKDVAKDPEQEPEYQQYSSSRISTCMIVPGGKRINFTNYEYYTKDPEIIAYLDKEIAAGMRVITKGKMVSQDDLNPAAALRRKTIEEFKASQEGRDFSESRAKPKPGAGGAGTGAVSTAGVANQYFWSSGCLHRTASTSILAEIDIL